MVCLPFSVVILGRHDLTLLRRLLQLFGGTGVNEVGSETGVVRPFAFFRGDQFRLLLYGSKLHLHVALLQLWAGPARNTGNGKAGRAVGRGGGLLRGRRRRKRRICHRSSGHSCLLFFLAFGLKLVLQLLHVAVGVVLQCWLRGLPLGRALSCRCLLVAGGTEECRHNHQQCRTQINEGLEVFLQDAFWQRQVAAQCWLCWWAGVCLCVRSKVVVGHHSYPFRVKLIRFLPSSTYPSSMTFGMM